MAFHTTKLETSLVLFITCCGDGEENRAVINTKSIPRNSHMQNMKTLFGKGESQLHKALDHYTFTLV